MSDDARHKKKTKKQLDRRENEGDERLATKRLAKKMIEEPVH